MTNLAKPEEEAGNPETRCKHHWNYSHTAIDRYIYKCRYCGELK